MALKRPGLVLASATMWLALSAAAEVRVVDDRGQSLSLPRPAERVISLAPHLTENLFAIGAGDLLIGTVSFSDFPDAARRIPRIGSHARIDLERIVALQPDLIVAWHSGNNRAQVRRLKDLGLPVFSSEPRTFTDIIDNIEELGVLTGRAEQALQLATQMRREIRELASRHRDGTAVRVFYQVWDQPLMTINDTHLIGHAIQLCGGVNVFGQLDALVPRVDVESVLAADPELIVSGGRGEDRNDWLQRWRQWPSLQAVRREQLVFIPPSLLQRQTPRVLQGARRLCQAIEAVRQNRRHDERGTGS